MHKRKTKKFTKFTGNEKISQFSVDKGGGGSDKIMIEDR